jgi:hypothetical protein
MPEIPIHMAKDSFDRVIAHDGSYLGNLVRHELSEAL